MVRVAPKLHRFCTGISTLSREAARETGPENSHAKVSKAAKVFKGGGKQQKRRAGCQPASQPIANRRYKGVRGMLNAKA